MSKKKDYSKRRPISSGWELCVECGDYNYIIVYQDVDEYEGILFPAVYWECQECFEKWYRYKFGTGQYDEILGFMMLKERLNKKEG